jgi:hypothetical protein
MYPVIGPFVLGTASQVICNDVELNAVTPVIFAPFEGAIIKEKNFETINSSVVIYLFFDNKIFLAREHSKILIKF